MDKSYKRSENIDEKINDIKLAYNVWRTLFIVDENTTASQIAEILEEEQETAEAELTLLEEAGLIMATEADSEPDTAVEQEPVMPEETESEKPAEDEEELFQVEEEPAGDAPKTEILMEEEALSAEEPEEEEIHVEEAAEEPEPDPVETETAEEEAPVAEEDIEINIHDEEASEADLLDVDFSEEITEKEEGISEEAATAEEPVPQFEPEQDSSGKKSVLVIDDSIVIRKMVEIALENEDYLIHTAVSGKDGLAKIDQLNPSLIILDLMLPDINGIDILKTVKASRKTPVIMLSGKDSPQMVEKAKETGADAFLPKPFKDDELIEKINALI